MSSVFVSLFVITPSGIYNFIYNIICKDSMFTLHLLDYTSIYIYIYIYIYIPEFSLIYICIHT